MKYCGYCGEGILEQMAFCTKCGQKQETNYIEPTEIVNLTIYWEPHFGLAYKYEILHNNNVIGTIKKHQSITVSVPKDCTMKFIPRVINRNIELVIRLELETNPELIIALCEEKTPKLCLKYPYGRLRAYKTKNCRLIEEYYLKNGQKID